MAGEQRFFECFNGECLPLRHCYVPPLGLVEIPTHVVRVDGDRAHGWQVRLSPSKFFSDRGRSPLVSLDEAKQWLVIHYSPRDRPARHGVERSGKTVFTGESGVMLHFAADPRSETLSVTVRVLVPRRNTVISRGLGSPVRLTRQTLLEEVDLAIAVRRYLLDCAFAGDHPDFNLSFRALIPKSEPYHEPGVAQIDWDALRSKYKKRLDDLRRLRAERGLGPVSRATPLWFSSEND